MGARTREVGGGSATGVANEFNNFLAQQLRGATPPSASDPRFLQQFDRTNPNTNFENWSRQQTSNAMQPGQQTSNFGNAFNAALGGQVNDMSGAGGALQNFFRSMQGGGQQGNQFSGLQSNADFMRNVDPNDPRINTPEFQQYMQQRGNAVAGQQQGGQQGGQQFQGQLSLPQFQNQFTAPQFQQAQLSQLPTNFGQGQTGMADLSGFGNAAQSNFQINPLNSQFTGQLQGLLGAGQNAMQNFQNSGGFSAASAGQDVQMQPGMDFGQAYNTLGQDPLAQRELMLARADQRARFGAEGAGGLGTGAQFAESNLNAAFNAQDASNRRNQAMQLMGQDLANRSAFAQTGLQNRGQNVQTAIANMQGGLQGAQNQISGFNAQNNALGQMLNAAGQARGQDLNTGLGQQQLGLNQSTFNVGQANNMQNAMLGSALQNQGLGNQFGLGSAGLNNQAMQQNNANNINTSQFQNTFNQNNSQLGAQFGQANNALNSQNMTNQAQINNQMLQSMIGQGLNMNQLGNQNTMQMLSQLFGGFGQANQLGTAQRQNVVTPSPWGQAISMLGSLGSAWLQGGGGNPFGGGGGGGNIPQMPPVNVPTVNIPAGNMNALGSMAPMSQWRSL